MGNDREMWGAAACFTTLKYAEKKRPCGLQTQGRQKHSRNKGMDAGTKGDSVGYNGTMNLVFFDKLGACVPCAPSSHAYTKQ